MIVTTIFCIYLLFLLYKRQLTNAALLLVLLYVVFNLPIWETEGLLASRLAFISPLFIAAALTLCCKREAALFAVLLLISQLTLAGKDYVKKDSPIKLLLSQNDTIRSWVPIESPMRADHGLQFMLTYALHRKAEKKYPSKGTYYELVRGNTNYRRCFAANEIIVGSLDSYNCLNLGNGWLILKRQTRK